jgi:methionine-rich copper-binding protein CopC
MNSTTIGTMGVALALLLGLTLTGCTATTSHNVVSKPVATHTAKPAVNLAELKVGDAVDDSTAAAINAKGGKIRAYKLPSGSYVVINEDQPLPAAVQADVNAVAKAGANNAGTEGSLESGSDGHAVQGTIEFSTGKNVAVIQYGTVSTYSGDTFVGYLGVASFYNGSNPAPVSTSEATVQADLQAEINKQSDPASWIIVVNN